MNLPDLLELHRLLVECPSVSHEEEAIADLVEDLLRSTAASVERLGNNILAHAGKGPRLLLNSHLDTVPATDQWARDPHRWIREDDRIYGLGSNDAKASVACMMFAFQEIARNGGPVEATLMLVPEEETGGEGTQKAWPYLKGSGRGPKAAIVGEPTGLDLATSQKGLLILELIAEGDAWHSANAQADGAKNPIRQLARDLVRLEGLDLGPDHPQLGPATLEPTVLSAGEQRNMVPGTASAYLDIRTGPNVAHEDIIHHAEALVSSRLRVHSNRFFPRETPARSLLLEAAKTARPKAKRYASRTLSDWVYLDIPAIKVGPGRTERSHTPDEFVLVQELEEGVAFYRDLMTAYSALAESGDEDEKTLGQG